MLKEEKETGGSGRIGLVEWLKWPSQQAQQFPINRKDFEGEVLLSDPEREATRPGDESEESISYVELYITGKLIASDVWNW